MPGESLNLYRNGTLRYTPPPTFLGSRSFSYRIYGADGSVCASPSTPVTLFIVGGAFSTQAPMPTQAPAPKVTGACCNPNGVDASGQTITCMDDCTWEICQFSGGVWQGNETLCSQVLCGPENTTAPVVLMPHDLLECPSIWSPVCRPSSDPGCPYGYSEDWTCLHPVRRGCDQDDWKRKMAKLYAEYYKGDTINVLFADMLGGICDGPNCAPAVPTNQK